MIRQGGDAHASSSFGDARQLAPPILVAFLATSAATRAPWALRASAAYFTVAFALGAEAGRRDGASPGGQRLVVLLVHIAWGARLFAGLATHWNIGQRFRTEFRTAHPSSSRDGSDSSG